MTPKFKRILKWSLFGLAFAILALNTLYVVNEGFVGITKKLGKVEHQVDPGFHVKIPFITSVKHIEIREKRNLEDLSAATRDQLPITASVSINWSVDSIAARQLYIEYGSLNQFYERILSPNLKQAAKAALAKFRMSDLIGDRNAAIEAIQLELVRLMDSYPIRVHSPQIENLVAPERYLEAILVKEEQREATEREAHKLKQQELQAAQLTQTAKAERDATKARADGEAYRLREEADAKAHATRVQGEAEADAIRARGQALKTDQNLIEYEKARRWNGELPTTMIPGGSVPLLNLN